MPAIRRAWSALVLASALLVLAGCQSRPGDTTAGLPPPPVTGEPATPAPAPRVAVVQSPAGPVTVCCVSTNLWERMRAGFRMDLDNDNDRIAAQRNWYIRNQAYLDRVFARGARYLHHIVSELEARDMPAELALLPVVESAFDPYAYSVAHAAGPWQFIPSTGRVFGMKQDWWFDGRRDILLSTRSALSYLEQLSARFDGNYELALAAYNAGGGTVSRAIKRNLRDGRKTDYWSLQLPQETRAYVPKLIALAQVVRDPARYGVRLNPIPDQASFAVVDLPREIDLARAAELADMPLAELHLYNPAHSRWVTDPEGPHRLLVPVDVAPRLKAGLAALEDAAWAVAIDHTVAEGETVAALAARYQVSADAIRELNDLDDEPDAGATIRVPRPHLLLASAGDTYVPRILAVAKRREELSRAPRVTRYQVKRGDTLSGIARRHGVSLNQLASWNNMKPSKPLQVGQQLVVKRGGSSAPVAVAAAPNRSTQKRVSHKVRRGDTLYGLARKFNVSVHDIARWNDFSPKRQLRAGEVLKIFQD